MRGPFSSPTSKCLAQLAMLHAAHAFAAPLSSSSRWALRSPRSAGTIGKWRGGASSMSTAPPTSYDSSAYELKFTEMPSFTVSTEATAAAEWSGDLLVLPLYATPKPDGAADGWEKPDADLTEVAAAADSAFDGAVSSLVAMQEFKAGPKDSSAVFLGKSTAVKSVALVGMGEAGKVKYTGLGGALAALAKEQKCESMAVAVPEDIDDAAVQAMMQGMLDGLYSDNRYRTGDNIEKDVKLTSLTLVGTSVSTDGADRARKIMAGVNVCRDLVASPPNVVTPKSLAEMAVDVAMEHGLEAEILEREAVEALGMGAYMGVAKGSLEEHGPKFIHLTYKPPQTPTKKVAIVGKGLTFDSGGYNLKVGASLIELMKFDMGGSGATLGTAKAIGLLKPKDVEVHFIVAACENMISDKAMRPGDILTASNGKTIEVTADTSTRACSP
mmetsp:Transcript_58072/g.160582  ORF Transcript_58072/g.160582 Transcript_58072/m.160582 type:complete len:441 (+) Transcript_58072:189-1511(+)